MNSATRDDAYEVVALVDQLTSVGARPATSPAEARAAAFVNGRLRRAGMGVSTYALRSVRRPGGAYAVLAALGLVATALTPLLPQPSLLFAAVILAALLYDALFTPLLPLWRRGTSQNIVGIRAIADAGGLVPRLPRWRVVLLAPLDTPAVRSGLGTLAGPSRFATLTRLAAPSLLLGAALGLWLAPAQPAWWVLLATGGLLLLALLIADLLPLLPAPEDGSRVALATLVATASRLGALDQVELWAVAVGAAASDPAGALSLLARYPFENEATLVIALEQFTGNQLVYATREGGLVARPADALLVRLAAAADAADPRIDAEPRSLEAKGALAGPLQHRGMRTLSISAREAPESSAVLLAERATRLVVGIVRALDAER